MSNTVGQPSIAIVVDFAYASFYFQTRLSGGILSAKCSDLCCFESMPWWSSLRSLVFSQFQFFLVIFV